MKFNPGDIVDWHSPVFGIKECRVIQFWDGNYPMCLVRIDSESKMAAVGIDELHIKERR